MGYTETLLANGERVVRRAHQHWFVLVWNARYSVLAIILAIVGLVLKVAVGNPGGFLDTLMSALGWIVLILLVGGVLWFAWGLLRYRNEEYVITSRRIIHAEGVINKRATDSSLEKINDAILTESLFGRMFGFGDLDVLTASESGIERLRMLKDAKTFKKAMLESKHELEIEITRPTMPPASSAPAASTPAADWPTEPQGGGNADEISASLERLAGMRDKGLITQAEYDAKKQELLDRL